MNKVYRRRRRKEGGVQSVRTIYTVALPQRACLAATCLRNLNEVFRELFVDENFMTLLRAESMTMIPAYLKQLVEEGKDTGEIDQSRRRRKLAQMVPHPDGDLVAALGIASQESIRRSVESDGVLSLRRMVIKESPSF